MTGWNRAETAQSTIGSREIFLRLSIRQQLGTLLDCLLCQRLKMERFPNFRSVRDQRSSAFLGGRSPFLRGAVRRLHCVGHVLGRETRGDGTCASHPREKREMEFPWSVAWEAAPKVRRSARLNPHPRRAPHRSRGASSVLNRSHPRSGHARGLPFSAPPPGR